MVVVVGEDVRRGGLGRGHFLPPHLFCPCLVLQCTTSACMFSGDSYSAQRT